MVNMVDETGLIYVVRTMFFSIVHSSGINNIVGTGVNNIDERTSCFSVVRTTIIMLVDGKKNLNLTPIEIPVFIGCCRYFEKQIERQP